MSFLLSTLAGLAALCAGCLCLYASSPHQRVLRAPWPTWPSRGASAALLALAWLLLAGAMQRLTAAFLFATALMLALTLLPYIGALLHVRRTR